MEHNFLRTLIRSVVRHTTVMGYIRVIYYTGPLFVFIYSTYSFCIVTCNLINKNVVTMFRRGVLTVSYTKSSKAVTAQDLTFTLGITRVFCKSFKLIKRLKTFCLRNWSKFPPKNNHLRIVVVESTDSSKEQIAI